MHPNKIPVAIFGSKTPEVKPFYDEYNIVEVKMISHKVKFVCLSL